MSEPFDIRPRDAARMIGVRPQTVSRWAEAGFIPCWRRPGKGPSSGRYFRRSDILRFIEEGKS
jgi:DNA-binding transcriptional MerR regulator